MNPHHSPRRYLLYANQDYSFPILRPLQKAIVNRGDSCAWFTHGDVQPDRYLQTSDRVLPDTAAVIDYHPMAVITPNNTVPHFFPGIKTQVFHGFNARKRSNGGVDSHFAIRGFFDLYCTHGPNTTETFQRLSDTLGYFKVVETGWPKMDPLADQPVDNNTGRRPTIMLTSTFSAQLTCAMHLLPTFKRLVAKNDKNWLVQLHPKMSPDTVKQYQSIQAKNYQYVDTSDVMPYLARTDVMVSDTSSILQEFLQLVRPVITFRNRTPGPWLIDIHEPTELAGAIERALNRPPSLIEAIRSYNADLHPYTDGKSSERVLQAIDSFIASENRLHQPKPLNLIRKFKVRKELSYWRP